MFCSNCGKEISDNAYVCPGCGVKVRRNDPGEGPLGCWLGGVCFLWPIIGLILYLSWKGDKPLKAKSAGKAALWGFVIVVIFAIIYYGVIIASIASYGL